MDFLNHISHYQWIGIFLHTLFIIGILLLIWSDTIKKKKKLNPKKPNKKIVWFKNGKEV
jgi:hypothetical protein|tara:strand:- start:639 stop:815 length:177 start_codon:yes stop_codon:yes gene_type:complete